MIKDLWSCEEVIKEQHLEEKINRNFIECMYQKKHQAKDSNKSEEEKDG